VAVVDGVGTIAITCHADQHSWDGHLTLQQVWSDSLPDWDAKDQAYAASSRLIDKYNDKCNCPNRNYSNQ
jgi:hypothetical protein